MAPAFTRICNLCRIVFKPKLFATTRLSDVKPLQRVLSVGVQDKISSLQIKKRPAKKKRALEEEDAKPPGQLNVVAFSTAEEYNLERLLGGLKDGALYEPRFVEGNADAIHAVARHPAGGELFFFREGAVVMWNVGELEGGGVLGLARRYESDGYAEAVVRAEAERMSYREEADGRPTLTPGGEIVISAGGALEKYAVSNAMALSVKLGCWEAALERYIDAVESVTDDLKSGRRIRMGRDDVLRRHGELFALRHVVNLSSDLLDTPDFYWDRDRLEALYSRVCAHFGIAKRTRVVNEKINHCVELIELLSSHLGDKHHVRLEWMVIVLIMVEVGFETLHYIDRIIAH